MRIVFILCAILVSCNTVKPPEKMQNANELSFLTTDGKKYILKRFSQTLTTTVAVGTLLAPSISIYQTDVTNPPATATNPRKTNQIKSIIPIYFSQSLWREDAVYPNLIYKVSTPYLVMVPSPYGYTSFQNLLAPHCKTIRVASSFYTPASVGPNYYTVGFSGTVICEGYEKVAFHSSDFIPIQSPTSGNKAISFLITHDNAVYNAQSFGPDFPTGNFWRSPVLNDYDNVGRVGVLAPANGDVTGQTEFIYFELQ